MNYLQLSGYDFNATCKSLDQAKARLEAIEKGGNLIPMKYSARLTWEGLYEVREVFRGYCLDSRGKPLCSFVDARLTFSMPDLSMLLQVIEQVMVKLQQIEMGQDMIVMKASAQECIHMLDVDLFHSWMPGAMLVEG